jgi:hypothetical protein
MSEFMGKGLIVPDFPHGDYFPPTTWGRGSQWKLVDLAEGLQLSHARY